MEWETSLENLKKRIQQLKKKRPGYKEILNFYQKIREEQEEVKPSLKIKSIPLKKEWKDLLAKEGFSLLEKKDFPLDINASLTLFRLLCEIGKKANPRMAEQVEKIEEGIDNKKMDLNKALTGGFEEGKIEKIAKEFGLDKTVLLFLIQESIRPSIEAGTKKLLNELNAEAWLKGYCPICGSLPSLSLLKDAEGKRFLLCSFCGYQWRVDRFFCAFCGNKEQDSLHYFCGEGEETHRIDTCDKCHQYIKTIDARNIEIIDPVLEDLATLHLDLLATQKGYRRPAPSPWTP
ncbi:MAG: formate dehydrogenase accessory protein FdhE [Thermodesulfobacteriota bacterium]|nr:formate dehydrogenase accessory protein FdhE [Thermodesulfobacteriota bacterium]